MRDQQVNTFGKGMMKDLSASTPQEGSYVDAQNIRIISDGSGIENASGIVIDVKGNKNVLDLTSGLSYGYPAIYTEAIGSEGGLVLFSSFNIDADNYVIPSGVTYIQIGNGEILKVTNQENDTFIPSDDVDTFYGWVGNNPLQCEEPSQGEEDQIICLGVELFQGLDIGFYEALDTSSITGALILGHTTVRDTLVLFTLLNYSGQGITSAILTTNLDASVLIASVVYAGDLGFDSNYPIEAVGRYESEEVQRIYWTDNLNPVRTLNIKSDILQDLTVSMLDLNSPAQLEPIKIVDVFEGGELPAGVYHYAYRLRSAGGSETRFTPLSNPVHVVQFAGNYWKYSEDPENIQEINGTSPGEITGGAVKLYTEVTDSRYESVEFAVAYKNTLSGIESTYIIKDVPAQEGSVSVIHTSNVGEPLSLEELTAFSLDIKKAKTLSSKDNRLFVGNVTTNSGGLEFNSRAYRYKRDDGETIHYPYSGTDAVSTYVTFPEAGEVHESDLEAVNPFNELESNNIDSSNKYKYLKDGVTLGGEGVNVKYTFIKKRLSGDSFYSSENESAPYISGKQYFPESDTEDIEEFTGDYKSGAVNALYKGYHRDEVYRFGIVLYDTKGNPGYVNWVGDIRFPAVDDIHVTSEGGQYSPVDGAFNFSLSQTKTSASGNSYYSHSPPEGREFTDPEDAVTTHSDVTDALGEVNLGEQVSSGFSSGEESGGDHYLFALGIEFEVNIPEELEGLTTGYSVVRVKREPVDSTFLGVGMLSPLNIFRISNTDTGGGQRVGFNRDLYNLTSSGNTQNYRGVLYPYGMTVDSPDFAFSGVYPSGGPNAYLQVYGTLSNGREANAYRTDFSGESHTNYRKYLSHITKGMRGGQSPFYKMLRSEKIGRGSSITIDAFPGFEEEITNRKLYNYSLESTFQTSGGVENTSQGSAIVSVGEETLYVQMKSDAEGEDNPATIVPGDYLKDYGQDSDQAGPNSTQDLSVIAYEKILVAYRKNLNVGGASTQYGGANAQSRRNNAYISTGHFSGTSSSPQKVFGGDTYVTVYDIEKVMKYSSEWSQSGLSLHSDVDDDYPKKTRTYAYSYPVETRYNTSLRKGWHFSNKEDFSANTEEPLNQFLYEDVYSAENDLGVFIPRPLTVESSLVEILDNRVLYSEPKQDRGITDNWRTFKLESFKDVEAGEGSITKLINFKNNLYYIQDRGVGVLNINPISTVVDTDGTSIVLGVGDVIQEYSYYSTAIGAQNVRDITSTSKGIYWIDKKTKKAYAFRANGLDSISDTHGMKSWFASNVNKDSRITLGNDVINDEVLFSVDDTTLAFSEVLNKFTSFYPYGTSMYINTYDRLFSINPSSYSDMYEHNIGASSTFFGVKTNSYIEFLVNKHPIHTKVFDTIEWYTASVGNRFESSVFKNSSDTKVDDLSEAVSKERHTRMPVPRTATESRFRDAYMKVKLSTSKEFTLHYVKTSFRISKR